MKDKEAKRWLLDLLSGIQIVDPVNPHLLLGGTLPVMVLRPRDYSDLQIIIPKKQVIVSIEYENSSRGMVSHVCKHYRDYSTHCYYTRAKKIVVFVRTKTHIEKHGSDFRNAMSVANKLKNDRFEVLSMDENEFENNFLKTTLQDLLN